MHMYVHPYFNALSSIIINVDFTKILFKNGERQIRHNFYITLLKNEKFTLNEKYTFKLTTNLVKNVDFNIFWQINVRINFRHFHTLHSVEITKIPFI